jgi:hypothetical protein
MRSFLFCLTILGGLSLLQAQLPPQVQTTESVQTTQKIQKQGAKLTGITEEPVQEIYPGEKADTGPQFMVRVKERPQWVDASVDSQYFYTSNMFLGENTGVKNSVTDTAVWVNTAQVAFSPNAFDVGPGKLKTRVGFRQQWYNYGLDDTFNQLNNFDFDVQTVFSDAVYTYQDTWLFTLGFDWTRLLGHEQPIDNYAEFYKEYVPKLGVTKLFPINENHIFTVDFLAQYHFTEVDPPFARDNDRADYNAVFSYTWQAIPRLLIQPYYRFQYTDYTQGNNGDRDDFLHTVGLGISYYFEKWCSIRTFVSYDHKESDDDPIVPDYRVLNAGLGASLNFRF